MIGSNSVYPLHQNVILGTLWSMWTGQPVSLFPSFQTISQTANVTVTHNSRWARRAGFTFVSL